MIQFLSAVYQNNKAVVIGAYGMKCKPFEVKRGIKQGDPSSCILINLFFDPILRHILTKQGGNGTHNGNKIPNPENNTMLGFVDDWASIMWNREKFQGKVTKVIETLKKAGLEVAIDMKGASKTVVMTNDQDVAKEGKITITPNENGMSIDGEPPKTMEIPVITGTKTYKYLGYWINVNLDWNEHLMKIDHATKMHVRFLSKRCYSAKDTTQVCNQS